MTMTDDETAPADPATAAVDTDTPKKKRSNLVPALVLAVGMVAAAFLMKPAPDAGAAGEVTTTTTAAGAVIALDAMTLNLDDGRLIRIGVALELSEEADPKEFEEYGATNRLKDLIIFEVSGLTSAEVSTPEGLESLKHTLTQGAHELYGHEFHGLYLTDLVVQ